MCRDNGTRSTTSIVKKGLLGCQFGYREDCVVQIHALGEGVAFDSEIELGNHRRHSKIDRPTLANMTTFVSFQS